MRRIDTLLLARHDIAALAERFGLPTIQGVIVLLAGQC